METTKTPSTTNPRSAEQSPAEQERHKMIREYSDEAAFSHINTISTVRSEDLAEIRRTYSIPLTHDIRIAHPSERMYYRPGEWTTVSLAALKYGVRFPLLSFIITLLGFIGIGLAQLVPNSYIHIVTFIAFCHDLGVTPSIDRFFSIYVVGRSREAGFRQVTRQPSRTLEKRPLMKTPTSNKGWHPLWFFIKGPSLREVPAWCEASHPNVTLGELSDARMHELMKFVSRLPQREWDLELLSNSTWLYEHRCKSLKHSV